MSEFVSIREAARRTGLSQYTIRMMHERGQIVSFPKYVPGQKNSKAYVNLDALCEQIGINTPAASASDEVQS